MTDKFPEVARLDEKGVRKAASQPPKFPRRRGPPAKGAISTEMTYMRVHPEVWAKALELAERPSHIQVVHETEVIVWNTPPPWPKGSHDV